MKIMDFDINKIKDFHVNTIAKREEAVALALADLDVKVAERFELEKERIANEVKEELIANAEAPYKHDIELCESFLVEVDEVTEEPVAEEVVTEEGVE